MRLRAPLIPALALPFLFWAVPAVSTPADDGRAVIGEHDDPPTVPGRLEEAGRLPKTEEDRCKDIAPPDPDALKRALALAEEDAEKYPAYWGFRAGMTAGEWSELETGARTSALLEIVTNEYCTAVSQIRGAIHWSSEMKSMGWRQTCEQPPEVVTAWKLEWKRISGLREQVEKDYPHGYICVQEDLVYTSMLRELETVSASRLAELNMVDRQCSYGRRQLMDDEDKKTVDGMRAGFQGELNTARLNLAYDNARGRGGPIVPGTQVAGRSDAPPARVVSARQGLKIADVPEAETFESLTDGIEFSGPDTVPAWGPFGWVGLTRKNPKKTVFEKALRHIYSIDEGKDVLRDIQRTRTRLSGVFKEGADRQAKEQPGLESSLAGKRTELAALEARIARDREAGKIDERPGTGDIYVPTNDPFKPYKKIDSCPEGDRLIVTDWPNPGDMRPEGADLRAEVERIEGRIKMIELVVEANRDAPKPIIGVEIEGDHPLTGGYARPNQWQIYHEKDRGYYHFNLINISESWLKDRNPSRPVDKVMIHELRHVADQGMFADAAASEMRWLLGEDRAYLSQSRAVMQQQEAMKKEPKSRAVEYMKEHDAEPLLRNPASSRLHRIASPNYLWHIAPADLEDPDAALQGRLDQAYWMLQDGDAERRKATAEEIDPTGKLTEALEQAEDESGSDSEGRRTRFLELAGGTEYAQKWKKRLEEASASLKAPGAEPPKWHARFKEMEKDYWKRLRTFTTEYPVEK